MEIPTPAFRLLIFTLVFPSPATFGPLANPTCSPVKLGPYPTPLLPLHFKPSDCSSYLWPLVHLHPAARVTQSKHNLSVPHQNSNGLQLTKRRTCSLGGIWPPTHPLLLWQPPYPHSIICHLQLHWPSSFLRMPSTSPPLALHWLVSAWNALLSSALTASASFL